MAGVDPAATVAALVHALDAATLVLGASDADEQLAALGVDATALRVLARRLERDAALRVARGTTAQGYAAAFAGGFVTAVMLLEAREPANCERCGGTPDGSAHERWCDRD